MINPFIEALFSLTGLAPIERGKSTFKGAGTARRIAREAKAISTRHERQSYGPERMTRQRLRRQAMGRI